MMPLVGFGMLFGPRSIGNGEEALLFGGFVKRITWMGLSHFFSILVTKGQGWFVLGENMSMDMTFSSNARMMSKGRSLAGGISTRQAALGLDRDGNRDAARGKIIRVPTRYGVIKGRSRGILQEFFEFLGGKLGLEFGQRMFAIGIGNGTGTWSLNSGCCSSCIGIGCCWHVSSLI
jgi:hypothetical protein